MYGYRETERGNIYLKKPFDEFDVKSMVFDIIIKHGYSHFKLDAENLHIEDLESISRWIKEYDCVVELVDENTVKIVATSSIKTKSFVPSKQIDDMIKYCSEKIEYYRDLGSLSKVECYQDFIVMLKSLLIEEEDES